MCVELCWLPISTHNATLIDATLIDATLIDATLIDATLIDATLIDATTFIHGNEVVDCVPVGL
ncbi:MAG: pentapeptide repeat-containing protein [bacterium]